MSVTINAKGTSVPSFIVGKNGTLIEKEGVITPPSGSNLIVKVDVDNSLVVDAGFSNPALITTTSGQDLHLNPAVGGGQYLWLNANRWPTTDGTVGQVLVTNGSGVITWGAAGSATSATSAVTAAITDDNTTNATRYITWTAATSGSGALRISSEKLTFNPYTGSLHSTSFNATSTARVKDNIIDITPLYMDRFMQLRAREYDRTDYVAHEFGFIAEEVNSVYPELVAKDNEGLPSGVDYGKLTAVLTSKVQAQQTMIEQLQAQIAAIMTLIQGAV